MEKTPKENGHNYVKKEWFWKCPFVECNATGRKPTSHYKALHSARKHLTRFHKKTSLYPIMIKKEANENMLYSLIEGMEKIKEINDFISYVCI